jgi:hypothetical protein
MSVFDIELTRVYQISESTQLKPEQVLPAELDRLQSVIQPGANIAIAVGSRGVANIVLVVKHVVAAVKRFGGKPFVIPAMGSHGGANAEGQTEILNSYGVTEQSVGAPIKSSMRVVDIAREEKSDSVFMDEHVYKSDGVILINRIKPHTDYHGPYESGLVKMAVIGLGKHKGALAIHSYGIAGLKDHILPAARRILATGKIIAGLGLVENSKHETTLAKVLLADEILAQETELLEIARAQMPKLPVADIDVLIIDSMGKDISGSGIDTNIIGRIMIDGQEEPKSPRIKSIIVRDLTDASHGNAVGVGLADVITTKLYDKIDFQATYENVITSTFLERGKIPIIAENDRMALQIACRACGRLTPGLERIVRIRDTLHLEETFVSASILAGIKDKPGIEVTAERHKLLGKNSTFF